ncbi:MAG: hypothetical protein M1829_003815 [Trizodia sp. TS-e1964]|nr:MAG: hypothetical protein M1829_003815 [Trizodia sp. TS-e1964]
MHRSLFSTAFLLLLLLLKGSWAHSIDPQGHVPHTPNPCPILTDQLCFADIQPRLGGVVYGPAAPGSAGECAEYCHLQKATAAVFLSEPQRLAAGGGSLLAGCYCSSYRVRGGALVAEGACTALLTVFDAVWECPESSGASSSESRRLRSFLRRRGRGSSSGGRSSGGRSSGGSSDTGRSNTGKPRSSGFGSNKPSTPSNNSGSWGFGFRNPFSSGDSNKPHDSGSSRNYRGSPAGVGDRPTGRGFQGNSYKPTNQGRKKTPANSAGTQTTRNGGNNRDSQSTGNTRISGQAIYMDRRNQRRLYIVHDHYYYYDDNSPYYGGTQYIYEQQGQAAPEKEIFCEPVDVCLKRIKNPFTPANSLAKTDLECALICAKQNRKVSFNLASDLENFERGCHCSNYELRGGGQDAPSGCGVAVRVYSVEITNVQVCSTGKVPTEQEPEQKSWRQRFWNWLNGGS